jgi:hypothetical protein
LVSGESGSGKGIQVKPIGFLYAIVGSVYAFFSILHFTATVVDLSDFLTNLNVPSDPIIGVVMLIASTLFFLGAYRTHSGQEDGKAYVIVGWFMGVMVSFVSLLVLISNAVRSILIGVEDLADWIIYDDIVPGLYLGLLILFIAPVIMNHLKRGNGTAERDGGEVS